MNRDLIPFPRVHHPDCRCSSCFVQAWKRSAEIHHEPIPLRPAQQLPDRTAELDKIKRALAPKPSLIARFRDAAEPGDWAMVGLGTAIGVAFAFVEIVAAEWDTILAFVAAL